MLKKNILLVFLFLVIISCSTKRNSFKNRTYNKINTDLNILFNGNEALKEVKNSLEEKFIEDFTLPIRVEKVPIILKNDTLQIKDESTVKKDGLRGITGFMILDEDEKEKSLTGLEKVIYKANKSIAYHSMLIDGKEYNSSIYRADKMIGIVRFYRGQSIEAIEAFEYAKEIAKKITKKNEIDLWIAKTYMQLGNYKKAESIQLSLIKNGNKDIIKKALLDYIQLKLDQEKYNEVLGLLKREFFLEKNKNKKARLLFLTAQVEDILNLKKESLADYQKVRKFKPNYQIRLKAYTNYIFAKDTILPLEEIKLSKQLNRYLNNSIYFEFKDEIYYALAL
ncbi:MAG: tetratricopeptide repeat protein, partial [Solirubrobacteraceae bacterium]